jgi:endonuclease YncB( thermonuclease family)
MQVLSDLVFGKQVRVEWPEEDHSKRTLGTVLIEGKSATDLPQTEYPP